MITYFSSRNVCFAALKSIKFKNHRTIPDWGPEVVMQLLHSRTSAIQQRKKVCYQALPNAESTDSGMMVVEHYWIVFLPCLNL